MGEMRKGGQLYGDIWELKTFVAINLYCIEISNYCCTIETNIMLYSNFISKKNSTVYESIPTNLENNLKCDSFPGCLQDILKSERHI